MRTYDEKHIKNIALVGSAKSGKTTLAETMLFEAGIITKRGSVEEKIRFQIIMKLNMNDRVLFMKRLCTPNGVIIKLILLIHRE